MRLPPAPKFEKRIHHVVPQFWQKRFKAPGDPGPYYLNLETDHVLPPQGPGEKMAEEYNNIIFDEFFRPSDALEDNLSALERKMADGLDRLIATGEIDKNARVDIAMLMAVQACRYPEKFVDRLDLGKYLAIALADLRACPDAITLNRALRETGILPGANIAQSEFIRLQAVQDSQLAVELEAILALHGYEAYFNPSLIIAAADQVASHLLGLEWTLLHSSKPAFILSDRPVPLQIGYCFSIGLSASYALKLNMPTVPVTDSKIYPRSATKTETNLINAEVRSRARQLICGPGAWLQQL
jgi:hypothetical protein